MTEFETILGYEFREPALLKTALTHSSYANEHRCAYNERMEFLGDSVLSLVVSNYLYRKLQKDNEGKLSKIRSALVCEPALAALARKIRLGDFIRLGKGEARTGGKERDSVLSDAYEALIAAMYLDGGLKTAEKWLLEQMEHELQAVLHGQSHHDYKTELQEFLQKQNKHLPVYTVVAETGPDHHKDFTVEVALENQVIASGHGQNKKEAEQAAAGVALKKLHDETL